MIKTKYTNNDLFEVLVLDKNLTDHNHRINIFDQDSIFKASDSTQVKFDYQSEYLERLFDNPKDILAYSIKPVYLNMSLTYL